MEIKVIALPEMAKMDVAFGFGRLGEAEPQCCLLCLCDPAGRQYPPALLLESV